MTLDISGSRFEDYRNWVDKKRAKDWSWEKIFLAGKSSEEGLAAFIENQVEDNDWQPISVDDWYAFIDQYKDILDNIGCASKGPFVSENNDRKVPENYNSAWQRYKDNLINEKHFSMASVANIEKSALRTLNSLRDDNGGANAVKGLVVGNVQSGKTANMGALISMAADYGWNMFIILTGTIENLRVQNQKRFIKDLVNGNLTWVSLLHPGSKDTLGFSQLDLRESSNARYVTCCLKNSKRLEHLFKWLNSDKNKKKQLKVLLIDDEADQAGLNTKDVHADEIERTKINGYLCDIVNNTDKGKKKDTPYAAMDYVAYTATPYGNFLNEATEESLYPRDFIDTLCPSDFYFGPQQIFGDVVRYKWEGMPIINNIPGENKIGRNAASDDIAKLDAICNGDIDPKSGDIPDSLKQAIAWFSVAVAIRREQKSKDPVSMLMHHTMRIGKHTNIGFAVRYWFKHIDQDDFIDLCRSVYDEQTVQFSKDIFKETCSAYGELSGFDLDDINDYPSFTDLKKHLYDLYENVRHVCFDDTDESYVFHKGIHICIDNSACESIDETENAHVRLIYPEEGKYNGYAPAFLVIGGNTLSRGLTLEGLVCTYFSRDVGQADSLMQMGRWFGYRRGYELLPRIWMTGSAQEKFEWLTLLDTNLRTDLNKYSSETKPIDIGPIIMNNPGVVKLKITSKNKSQSMINAEMNFAGANVQTINFVNDPAILKSNLDAGNDFITFLVNGKKEAVAPIKGRRLWKNISFEDIWNQFLCKYQGKLTHIDDAQVLKEWIEGLSASSKLDNWNVVLSGPEKGKNGSWNNVNKIIRTRKISGVHGPDTRDLCIGVISDPNDWRADIDFSTVQGLTDEDRALISGNYHEGRGEASAAEGERRKMDLRAKAGEDRTPLMVLYCVDKDSVPTRSGAKKPLNTFEDLLGIYIRIPGHKLNDDFTSSVTIDLSGEKTNEN